MAAWKSGERLLLSGKVLGGQRGAQLGHPSGQFPRVGDEIGPDVRGGDHRADPLRHGGVGELEAVLHGGRPVVDPVQQMEVQLYRRLPQ